MSTTPELITLPPNHERYKFLDVLGEGGQGIVFKGYDIQLQRFVAIKSLARGKQEKHETVRKEALTLANLRHPNIVSVYDVVTHDGSLMLVMELIEGEDLASWLEGEALSLDDFQQFGVQTLEALLAAHEAKILHRDLKPDNIRVSRLPGGRLMTKVMDFGLARESLNARRQTETLDGGIRGTVRYMSPEQLERMPMDPRADLYSLACVFYTVLCGRNPYGGDTIPEIITAHLEHRVKPLAERNASLPEDLCTWVMWTMNRRPEDRPQSTREALDAFNGVFENIKAGLHINRAIEIGLVQGTDTQTTFVQPHRTETGIVLRQAMNSDEEKATAAPSSDAKFGGKKTIFMAAAALAMCGAGIYFWPKKTADVPVPVLAPAPAPITEAAPPLVPEPKPEPKKPAPVVAKTEPLVPEKPVADASTTPTVQPGPTPDAAKKPGTRTYDPVEPTVSASRKPLPNLNRLLARYISTDHVMTYTDSKRQNLGPLTKEGGKFGAWMDLISAGGNRPLIVMGKMSVSSPHLQTITSPELRESVPCAVFEGNETIRATYPNKSADGASLNPKDAGFRPGYSLSMVVRLRSGLEGSRLAVLRAYSTDRGERSIIHLLHTPDGKLRLQSKFEGVDEPVVEIRQVVPSNTFLIVTAIMSQSDKKMRISVRGPAGETYVSPQIAFTDDLPSMNELHIGKAQESTSPTSTITPPSAPAVGSEELKGDLAEVIVYGCALNRDGLAQLEDTLAEHYFVGAKK